MNLKPTEPTDLGDNLLYILRETRQYHRDKANLLRYYVQERLNKSYESFEKEMQTNFETLVHRRTFKSKKKILKKL